MPPRANPRGQELSGEPQTPPHVPIGNPVNIDGPIAADDFTDGSSEFESDLSDITSLSSSVLEYEYENGRRYHSNRTVFYMMPNDEEEQDRMDLTHHIWLLLLRGELYKAPVLNPQKILDLGTGTGIWALDIADKFPQARITGNDISAIQPNWVAPNVEFIVEDFENEWLYPQNNFDFVHARLLAGCVSDWSQFFHRIYEHTKPGGYFEIQESSIWAWSDDGSLKLDSPAIQFLEALDTAGRIMGRELNIYCKLKDWMTDAGFEDVQQFIYPMPTSPWPRDPYLKEIGRYMAVMLQQAVGSYGLRLCTQVLGWGAEPAGIFHAMVKKQLRDKHMHAYFQGVVVFGRKPFNK